MDVVGNKALITSFRPEMAVKSIQQAFFDNGLCGNGVNAVPGDDFSVDDLLDFSNEDVEQGFVEEEKEEEKAFVSLSVSSQERTQNDYSNSSTFSVKEEFGSVPSSELSVPTDDIAELEWLSHFVEDSFFEFSIPQPERNPKEKIKIKTENMCEPEIEEALHKTPCFLATIPVKARSKRSRTGGRVWFIRSALSESSSTSSSSSSSTSSLIFANSGQNPELLYHTGKTPAKKQKKKPVTDSGGSQPQRRCSHCHVQKTPQWRTGPLGAKTLCNACGVRYKSGRLLPEYRPACSPTFSGDIHSNNHRKVVEMRLKKEMMTGPKTELTSAVQSF